MWPKQWHSEKRYLYKYCFVWEWFNTGFCFWVLCTWFGTNVFAIILSSLNHLYYELKQFCFLVACWQSDCPSIGSSTQWPNLDLFFVFRTLSMSHRMDGELSWWQTGEWPALTDVVVVVVTCHNGGTDRWPDTATVYHRTNVTTITATVVVRIGHRGHRQQCPHTLLTSLSRSSWEICQCIVATLCGSVFYKLLTSGDRELSVTHTHTPYTTQTDQCCIQISD